MRSIRVALSVVPLLFSSAAFAQHKMDPPQAAGSPSDAQISFDAVKGLAG